MIDEHEYSINNWRCTVMPNVPPCLTSTCLHGYDLSHPVPAGSARDRHCHYSTFFMVTHLINIVELLTNS